MAKPPPKNIRRSTQPRGRTGQRGRPRRAFPSLALWVITGLAVVAVGALIFLATRPQTPQVSLPPEVPVEGTVKGQPDAPLTMVEYSDFQ